MELKSFYSTKLKKFTIFAGAIIAFGGVVTVLDQFKVRPVLSFELHTVAQKVVGLELQDLYTLQGTIEQRIYDVQEDWEKGDADRKNRASKRKIELELQRDRLERSIKQKESEIK